MKASARLVPHPRSVGSLARPRSPAPPTHLRLPGNGPGSAPCPRAEAAAGVKPTPALRAGGNFPRSSPRGAAGIFAELRGATPPPGRGAPPLRVEPTRSLPRGKRSPTPPRRLPGRGSLALPPWVPSLPPVRTLLGLWRCGLPEAGAVASQSRRPFRAPRQLPSPHAQRGQEVLRAAGSGRTLGGSSRPCSPPRAPSGLAARRGTPPTARGSAGLLAAFGSPVRTSVREETTGNDRPSQPARHSRPHTPPAIPAAQLAAREPSDRGPGCPGRRALGSLLETPLPEPRRRPVPGRRCCRRPGRPPSCPASPHVGRSPRAPRSGKPGTSGSSQDPAAFCFHGSGVSENAFVFCFKSNFEEAAFQV